MTNYIPSDKINLDLKSNSMNNSKRFDRKQISMLKKKGFKYPIKVKGSRNHYGRIVWSEKILKNRFTVLDSRNDWGLRYFIFENPSDALFFKLRWS